MLRSIPKVMVGIDDRQIRLKDRLVVQREPIRPHREMRIWRIKADAHRLSLLTWRAAASRYSAALRVVRESPSMTSCVTPVVLAEPLQHGCGRENRAVRVGDVLAGDRRSRAVRRLEKAVVVPELR